LSSVVGVFEVGRWDVAAVLVEAPVVEPVDSFGVGVLDVLDGAPGAAGLDQLGLVQAVDRLGQGVVEAVADGPDGGVDLGFGGAFAERDRRVLGGLNWSVQQCGDSIGGGVEVEGVAEAGVQAGGGGVGCAGGIRAARSCQVRRSGLRRLGIFRVERPPTMSLCVNRDFPFAVTFSSGTENVSLIMSPPVDLFCGTMIKRESVIPAHHILKPNQGKLQNIS